MEEHDHNWTCDLMWVAFVVAVDTFTWYGRAVDAIVKGIKNK